MISTLDIFCSEENFYYYYLYVFFVIGYWYSKNSNG